MPKRLTDAEMDAAVAAGRPPESAAFADDDWEREQNDWLERWQPGERLPERSEPGGKRRKKWQSLTQTHGRHFDAAQARDNPQPDAPEAAEQAAATIGQAPPRQPHPSDAATAVPAPPVPPTQPTQPTLPLSAAGLTEQPILLKGIGLELAERILLDDQVKRLVAVPQDKSRRTFHNTANGHQSCASLDACALDNGETYLGELVNVDSETRVFTEIVQIVLETQDVASKGVFGKLGIFEPNFLTTPHSHPGCVVVNLGMGQKSWLTAAPGCAGVAFYVNATEFVQEFGDVVVLPAGMAHEVRTTAPPPKREHAYSFSMMLTPLSAVDGAMASLHVCAESLVGPKGSKKPKLNVKRAVQLLLQLKLKSATARSQWLAENGGGGGAQGSGGGSAEGAQGSGGGAQGSGEGVAGRERLGSRQRKRM